VVVVRHGLAVSEGICRKRWFDPERPQMAGLQTALTDAAKQWFHANYSLLRDFAYLRKAVLVRYEDLVADPAVTLARVTRACGLAPRKFPVPVFDLDRNARQLASLSSEERAEVVGLLVKESRKMRGGSAILRFLERRP
jgi:hypothetical protein